MAPVVKEFLKSHDRFQLVVCSTGQHREMLDSVLEVFQIEPDADLAVMAPGQTPFDITSKVLTGAGKVFDEVRPDMVFVHGDTTTSTAAALAAFYHKIPVAHVEAGLRTRNIYSPWPEEINRQLTGRLASYHYAPTPLSRRNLRDESVPEDRIVVTGNTVIDALYWVRDRLETEPALLAGAEEELVAKGIERKVLQSWRGGERRMVLITGHRRENFGEGFRQICLAIRELVERFPEVDFLYPVHPNPNVRKVVDELLGGEDGGARRGVYLIEPVSYVPFIHLMSIANVVLTDSGGVQEEAPSLGKPVLVMRDTTERPEAVEAGTVKLVGTSFEAIVSEVGRLLEDEEAYARMANATNPYGDGLASSRIVAHCSDLIGKL